MRVGTDVGRGDIVVGADIVAQRGGKTTGDAHQFILADGPWVDAERAFGTAEREAGECALHRHEQGEGFDFVEFNLGVVANSAFIGAEHIVVLYAVAFK